MQLAINSLQYANFVLGLAESRKSFLADRAPQQQRRKQGGTAKRRILNISYNEPILRTRHAILEQAGFEVVSALGFTEGLEVCTQTQQRFDLAIFGPSLPSKDKAVLIATIRDLCGARILSLRWRQPSS